MFKYFICVLLACVGIGATADKDLIGRKFQLPEYNESFVVSREVYEKANVYYRSNYYRLSNRDKFVVVDFSLNANKRRFLYIDLTTNSFTTYYVSHGLGSDQDGDGNADRFSDRWREKATALGAYRAMDSYEDKNGSHLRLKGLDASNKNADDRDVDIRGADYVSEADGWAGRSWGAFSMDPTIVDGVIDRLEDGVIIYADIP